jgi:flagellar biosynthesis regulator FlbT
MTESLKASEWLCVRNGELVNNDRKVTLAIVGDDPDHL